MSEMSMYDDWEYFRYRENMEDEDFSDYVPEILKNGFFDNQKRKSKTSKRTQPARELTVEEWAEIAAQSQAEKEKRLAWFEQEEQEEQERIAGLNPTEKLLEAVIRGAKHLPSEVADEIKAIFTPTTLATMVGVLGVYIAAHATGIGQAMDIGMLIAGGIFFGLDAFAIFKDIAGFAGAINATTEEELDQAGEHLASAIAKIGVDAVMTLLTKKVADEVGKSVDHVNQVDEVHAHSDDLTPGRANDVDNTNQTPSTDTEITPAATNDIEYPEGIHLDTNFKNHTINIDGFTQQKGVKGAHNLDIFNQAVSQYKLKVIRKDKHPTIDGIYEIEYQVPKKNKLQEYTGEYRTPKKPLVKTVYDPDIISNDKILEWGQQAAAQGYKNAISKQLSGYNETVNGLEFRIYLDLDTGKVKNVHPK